MRLFKITPIIALLLTTACGKSTSVRDFTSLKPDEKVFYGNLLYIPEVKDGYYDGKFVEPSDVDKKKHSMDYVDGDVSICVVSSIDNVGRCESVMKSKTWVSDKRDEQGPGRQLIVDEGDLFTFKSLPGETLSLSAIRVDTFQGYHEYTFKGPPVVLRGTKKVNYVGDIVVRLKKLKDENEFLGLVVDVANRQKDSRSDAFKKFGLPLTEQVGNGVINFNKVQYRISKGHTVQTYSYVPIYLPK